MMLKLKNALLWIWPRIKSLNVLIVCIAILSNAISHTSFSDALAYAFFIGIICSSLITIGRYGLSWLLCRRFPDDIDFQENWPGWLLMGPWICVALFVSTHFGMILTRRFIRLDVAVPVRGLPSMSSGVLYGMTLSLTLTLAGVYFLYSRARISHLLAKEQAALRTAAENQLKLLESQLEPHMLFNTLANLRVLIALDTGRAQAMLDQLIAFMRATLDASRTGSHSLASEFSRIGDYLALMQVRMGTRLQSRLDCPVELSALQVPPLLLQPLVENAIKHGLEPQINGGRIEVFARREGDTLILSVRDTGVGLNDPQGESESKDDKSSGSCFGMHQVRERIAILHGNAATLTLKNASDEKGGTIAILRLPIATSTTTTS